LGAEPAANFANVTTAIFIVLRTYIKFILRKIMFRQNILGAKENFGDGPGLPTWRRAQPKQNCTSDSGCLIKFSGTNQSLQMND